MEEKIELTTKILEFIIAIITIGTIFFSAIKPEYSNIYIIISLLISITLLGILIFKSKKNRFLRERIGLLNREISLCERDLYYSMKNSYKRDEDISTINGLVMNGLKKYVNLIAEILKKYINKQVTVSIRFFEEVKSPIDNSILRVLAFSENCDKDREAIFKDKEISAKKVSENTDFKYIVGESVKNKVDYIYEPNLDKLNDRLSQNTGKGYENQTPNRNRYYNGRIVIPIYMENNILFFRKETEGRDIKGFLCVDVKPKNAFPKNAHQKYFLIYLLESYASKLHIILNKYNYYLDSIMKGVKHDEEFHRVIKRKNKNINIIN